MTKGVAFVTGASRGIGRVIAATLAGQGHPVAIGYHRHRQEAEEVATQLSAAGCWAIAVGGDLAREEAVEQCFAQVEGQMGPVEVLVNNAGIAQQKLFTQVTPEEWDALFGVNVRGVFLCCRRALPGMIARKSGRIVNLSSIWGMTGASCEVPYSAAKAAVIGLTKGLAKEVGPSGITVNCVAPGVIATEMNAHLDAGTLAALREEPPLGVIGAAQSVADAVAFLVSPAGDFITGQVLSPNGGLVI